MYFKFHDCEILQYFSSWIELVCPFWSWVCLSQLMVAEEWSVFSHRDHAIVIVFRPSPLGNIRNEVSLSLVLLLWLLLSFFLPIYHLQKHLAYTFLAFRIISRGSVSGCLNRQFFHYIMSMESVPPLILGWKCPNFSLNCDYRSGIKESKN